MQHILTKALASGKLITFDAMYPSMAKLPRAEEVVSVVPGGARSRRHAVGIVAD